MHAHTWLFIFCFTMEWSLYTATSCFYSQTSREQIQPHSEGEMVRSLHKLKSALIHHFKPQTWQTPICPKRSTTRNLSETCLCILSPLLSMFLERCLTSPAFPTYHGGAPAGTQRQIYDKPLSSTTYLYGSPAVIGLGWTYRLDTGSNVFEKILKNLMRETQDVL